MEIWKRITGFENYEISNLGRVKSLKRGMLKPMVHTKGYFLVHLYNGNRKAFKIHRLVAKNFLNNPQNKPQVNHKNGIKTDNKVENLEWCTAKENVKHSFDILKYKGSMKGKFGKDCHNSKKINQYDLDGNFIKSWDSMADAGRFYGIGNGMISAVCKGKRNKTGGFKWEYL